MQKNKGKRRLTIMKRKTIISIALLTLCFSMSSAILSGCYDSSDTTSSSGYYLTGDALDAEREFQEAVVGNWICSDETVKIEITQNIRGAVFTTTDGQTYEYITGHNTGEQKINFFKTDRDIDDPPVFVGNLKDNTLYLDCGDGDILTFYKEGGTTDSSSADNSSAASSRTYTPVDIWDIHDALENNSLAAEEKYTGMYVEITGIVLGIYDNRIEVEAYYSRDDVIPFVECNYTSEEQINIAKKISKGDNVKVRGKLTNVGEGGGTMDIDSISIE
jgi:hypothetical protein